MPEESRADEARRLYRDERLSERAVAERMGVSKSAVHSYLVRSGTRRRRRGAPRGPRRNDTP